MLIHPEINPVALQLCPVAVHWYGLTYLAAFGLFMWLGNLRLRYEPFASMTGKPARSPQMRFVFEAVELHAQHVLTNAPKLSDGCLNTRTTTQDLVVAIDASCLTSSSSTAM